MKDKRIWLVILGILVIGIAVTHYTRSMVKSQTNSQASVERGTAVPGMSEETTALETGEADGTRTEGPGEPSSGLGVMPEPDMEKIPEPALAAVPEPDTAAAEPEPALAAAPESGVEEQEALGQPAAAFESGPAPAYAQERATDSQADSGCEGGIYRQRLNDLDTQIRKMQGEETDPNVYSIKTSAETEVKMWDKELNTVYSALLEILPQEEAEALAQEQKEWLRKRETAAAGQSDKAEGVGGISYAASLVELTRDRAYELADRYEAAVCGPHYPESESNTAVLP